MEIVRHVRPFLRWKQPSVDACGSVVWGLRLSVQGVGAGKVIA